MARPEVIKTYKLFIGGAFPRTESGRYYQVKHKSGKVLANACLASRKDFKNAVVAARYAFPGWSDRTAFNRAQIIYRMAEMLEGRKDQILHELTLFGTAKKTAEQEIHQSIDLLIYYAGWCDKYQQVFGSVNPVASSHYNFSVPEPTGVVAVIAPDSYPILGLVATMAPIIAGGNTCVILASQSNPLCAITFAEMLATSDLPAGVVNIITGDVNELNAHMSTHMDVNALLYAGNNQKQIEDMMANCATNVKRFTHWSFRSANAHEGDPYKLMAFQEIKTTWHPIEKSGVAGIKY